MNDEFEKPSYWSEAWLRHIERYLASPPRAGYWIASRFREEFSFLEIAGGSCRDSRYLAEIGRDSIGTDFDGETLAYVRQRLPGSSLRLQTEDAFGFSFREKSFDVTFSNGFLVLFRDDRKIHNLLNEQARVTRKFMVLLVHNAENKKLRAQFADKAKTDSLYDIRFFHREEIEQLVREAGIKYRKIQSYKFGGPSDRMLRSRLRGLPNPFFSCRTWLVPRLYRFQSWESTERVACVVSLE